MDPEDISIFRKILNWILRFRVTGDGVTFKNSLDGCSIDIRWPPTNTRSPWGGVFIANVQKDGGADGNLTTTATWTYTIIRLGVTVATTVSPEKPRPKGTATFQAGSSGFGLCFYGSDGTVHLYDAGEIYGVGSCP